MREVTFDEYLRYASEHNEITIEDVRIKLEPIKVKRLHPVPEELTDISTTVWSFPKRGSWATHRGNYRGNWPPQIPRALIQKYTKPGDIVLDPMIGSGTTCIEAKLLGRNCIGVDINYDAIILTMHRLYYLNKAIEEAISGNKETEWGEEIIDTSTVLNAWTKIYHGDARHLAEIRDESIDLVATHPPYFNIIRYGGKQRVEGDLSKARKLEEYLRMIKQVAQEIYRVLKPGGYLGILVGDTRNRKHYVPISHYVLETLLDTGFILVEEIVKIQHKMKTTREKWQKFFKRDFLLIYHEKLYILRKPVSASDYRKHRNSSKQPFIELKL